MKAAVVCSCFDNRIDDRRSPSLPRFHGRNVAAISDACIVQLRTMRNRVGWERRKETRLKESDA